MASLTNQSTNPANRQFEAGKEVRVEAEVLKNTSKTRELTFTHSIFTARQ
jgi:hypothetical protein